MEKIMIENGLQNFVIKYSTLVLLIYWIMSRTIGLLHYPLIESMIFMLDWLQLQLQLIHHH